MMKFGPRGARGQEPGASNSGVQITGGTVGDVQSQPGAVGSVQKILRGPSSAGSDDEWTRTLNALDAVLTGEPEGVTDPQSCRQLLALIREQNIGDAAQRDLAGSRLQLIRTMCTDAQSVLTLIGSALGLLGIATG
ncbi:hypothetical protein [Streptomyces griseorubiginosus]|uniref:hypothetical protein n=1 Tax=Streptomyces griseorubiginosus TaxID=67304 RepID=UPI001AD69518|nr:hypothetical protein [Streptomyces griseorubiginosus]MBO4260695.1 hypothetical protein [Streptomyces griseorubiginosus]